MGHGMKRLVLWMTAIVFFLALPVGASAQMGLTMKMGTLPDGAAYLIEVPNNWNGTLFLYSHGYVVPGKPNPAMDVGDPGTRIFMLANGFALAGSSYKKTGWAIQDALLDQIAVLDFFDENIGHPKRTIAWGHSLGGIITAGLIQTNPQRFDAALPMCGVLSGGVATWNTALDSAFAFNILVAGSTLELVHITNPLGNRDAAEADLAAAQATPQGRARLALVAALGDTPGWFDPTAPEPAEDDFVSQEANQFLWASQVDFPFLFALRAELEARAGGNPSWNTHVNYRTQLERSSDREEVKALYQAAGLSLDADLEMLEDAVRISADPNAVEYLEQNIIFDGEIHIPVLTLHTTGDGLVVVQNESAYREVVDEAGNGRFLRRTFVSRAGHCTFSPAETIVAVQTLVGRLDTGTWPEMDTTILNNTATSFGPTFNIIFIFPNPQSMVPVIVPAAPAFVEYKPSRYPRPFDAAVAECRDDSRCRDSFRESDRH